MFRVWRQYAERILVLAKRLECDRLALILPRKTWARHSGVWTFSSGKSQRDFVAQPRVGAQRLPWVDVRCGSQPQRGCVFVLACRKDTTLLATKRRNPFIRVENVAAWVASPTRQPWAWRRNPFGIYPQNVQTPLCFPLQCAPILQAARGVSES